MCLLLARIGKDGDPLFFGSGNNEFLGKGIVVGYAIIVPAILLTYLLGANLTILVRLIWNSKSLINNDVIFEQRCKQEVKGEGKILLKLYGPSPSALVLKLGGYNPFKGRQKSFMSRQLLLIFQFYLRFIVVFSILVTEI